MNRDAVLSDLERDEGLRYTLYDDHTGKPLKAGSVILGNPTIGIGWNTAGYSLTRDQYLIICGWILDRVVTELNTAFPWFSQLPDQAQRAMANMGFNLGVPELETFTTFLGLLRSGQYDKAADDLETTKWHRQVGDRAKRIEDLIRNSAGVA